MEQRGEANSVVSESIFELEEIPGPVLALKQQGDRSWVPVQHEASATTEPVSV